MAIPSASGSEAAKLVVYSLTDYTDLTPSNDHIWIILNIVLKNNHSSASSFSLQLTDDGGSTDVWLIESQALALDETFVWNDRIILHDNTSRLRIYNNSSNNLHAAVNYIDQNWS